MDKYKPGFMGKVIPADDPAKMTNFVVNQYDAFSKAYDACKDQSEKIDDVRAVESPSSDSFSMKLSTDAETMESIQKANESNGDISVSGDVITAKG